MNGKAGFFEGKTKNENNVECRRDLKLYVENDGSYRSKRYSQ